MFMYQGGTAMKKHLIIEIGTNTVKVLAAEYSQQGWKILRDALHPFRTSKEIYSVQDRTADKHQKWIEALKSIISGYSENSKTQTHVIATEGLRRACKAQDLVQKVKTELGLNIRILSGDEEAAFAFAAVSYCCNDTNANMAVIDIGGGSTEVIYGANNKISCKISIPVGAVVVTEKHFTGYPVNGTEAEKAKQDIVNSIKVITPSDSITYATGVGGTVTTLAMLKAVKRNPALTQTDTVLRQIEGSILTIDDVNRYAAQFQQSTIEQIQSMRPMPQGRADIILAGTLILREVMFKLALKSIHVSTRGVRYGYLYLLESEVIS